MNEKLKAVLDEVHFAPKPKKKDALELLKRAIQGEDLSPREWAQVMRYFTPAPPRTLRSLRDWLAAAVDPKSPRQDCHVVHRLPGGMLVATDGFRLHVASADHPDPVGLPPVEEWPKTSDPVARFIPGTNIAVKMAHARAARPVQYLGTVGSTADAGIPGSALFATPWGHAIVMPYRVD